MRSTAALVVALAASLPGCSAEYGNPFANDNPTVAPSATADLVYVTNAWNVRPGAGREAFAVEDTGTGATRLTFCNTDVRRCDTLEAALGPDRRRLAVRRVTDRDNNGRLTAEDGESLFMVDLARGVEGSLVEGAARVSGLDWYPNEEILFYSAGGMGIEDLYQVNTNGQANQNLTATATLRERRPRFNFNATGIAFERIEGATSGAVWAAGGTGLRAVTTPPAAGAALPSSPYVIGSDADPAFSPDGRRIVFRRLVALGNSDRGAWDVYTIGADGTGLAPLATGGGAFRGAADWGEGGIVFAEQAGSGPWRLVVVDPASAGRREIVSVGSTFELGFPRWMK
jgi:hypothetical protein